MDSFLWYSTTFLATPAVSRKTCGSKEPLLPLCLSFFAFIAASKHRLGVDAPPRAYPTKKVLSRLSKIEQRAPLTFVSISGRTARKSDVGHKAGRAEWTASTLSPFLSFGPISGLLCLSIVPNAISASWLLGRFGVRRPAAAFTTAAPPTNANFSPAQRPRKSPCRRLPRPGRVLPSLFILPLCELCVLCVSLALPPRFLIADILILPNFNFKLSTLN